MKRPGMSARFKVQALLYTAIQLGTPFRCRLCNEILQPEQSVQFDHTQALIHGGEHSYKEVRCVHTECHKKKTKQDVQANAKVKRLQKRGLTNRDDRSHKMKSRRFRKDLTRHMDGTITRRK